MRREDLADHACATAPGHVHVDEDDIRAPLADQLDRGVDVRGGTHDLDVGTELGAHAGEEQLVVVDEEHAVGRVRHR